MNKVGFWYSVAEPLLPMPVGDVGWPYAASKQKFITALHVAQSADTLIVYVYKGWSNCRICNRPNGNRTFKLGNYEWPQGYLHYIEEHDVLPEPGFYKFITEGFKS